MLQLKLSLLLAAEIHLLKIQEEETVSLKNVSVFISLVAADITVLSLQVSFLHCELK